MFQIPEISFFIDLALVLAIGFILGWERQGAGKILGERSMILLILGAFLFTYASLHVGNDHGRVVAQVVSGVGFIGGGIILKRGEKDILNLTTAIMVWTVAALGVLIGLEMRAEAILAAAIIFVTLKLGHRNGPRKTQEE